MSEKLVLFIDDDDERTQSLRQSIETLGRFDVLHVETPHDAVKEFEDHIGEIGLIVLDIMLPHYGIEEYECYSIEDCFPENEKGHYTGLRVLENLIKTMEAQNVKIPVIILTSLREDLPKCLRVLKIEVEKTLYKPISTKLFLREVMSLLPRETDGTGQ